MARWRHLMISEENLAILKLPEGRYVITLSHMNLNEETMRALPVWIRTD